jgi:hypothetical protein
MEQEAAERWEIDQDEFGNPLVRHRHPTLTVQAVISRDADGRRVARCANCGESFEVPDRNGPAG